MTMQATSTHTPAWPSVGTTCFKTGSFCATAADRIASTTSSTVASSPSPTMRRAAGTCPTSASARAAAAPVGTNATTTRASGCDA